MLIEKDLRYIKRSTIKISSDINLKCKIINYSLPDFLIIGAQKSGTTALYSYLVQHPGINKAKVNEVNYFANPHNHAKGTYWYSSHFPANSKKDSLAKKLGYMPISGEASPDMHMPFYPGLVHELLPSVKLIAIFRNPIDRAFSQYQHNCRHGLEKKSFKEVITQSPEKLPVEIACNPWKYHRSTYPSYLTRGLYVDQLERWFKFYEKDRLHIINSSDMFSNPQDELKKVLRFLEMPDYTFNMSRSVKHAGNYKVKMSDEMKEHLISVFRPYNRKLFNLIGKDFGWPS